MPTTNPVHAIDLATLLPHLLPRKHDAHKGDFGHVIVVGGDIGMAGSVRMAGEAAARMGAGLISIATQPLHATLIGAARPELMCYGVAHARDLAPLLARATVVIIGPGLGQTPWAQELLDAVLATDLPLIVDADALNLLAKTPHNTLRIQRHNWILTPHPGEAARLLNCDVSIIQADRYAAVSKLHTKFGGVCVLKGAGTLILGNNTIPELCTEGNPGMATGGMGDILSGVIGGLVAQQLNLTIAACLGVALHARAGDMAAYKEGQRGLLAMDVLPYLRQLIQST